MYKLSKSARWIRILAFTLIILIVCPGLPVSAEDEGTVPGPAFSISLEGEKLSGSSLFAGDVTVKLKSSGSSSLTAWIQDKGVWYALPKQENGSYQAVFSEDGIYDIAFGMEDASYHRSVKSAEFIISREAASLAGRIDQLPDPSGTSSDSLVLAREELLSLRSSCYQLPKEVRRAMPYRIWDKISRLTQRLSALQPFYDFTPPNSPSVTVKGAGISPGADPDSGEYSASSSANHIYGPPVDVAVSPVQCSDFDSILMIRDGVWTPLTPNEAGQYLVPLADPGAYQLGFCVMDTAGNSSEAVYVTAVINEDVCAITDETARLYFHAQDILWHQYAPDVEKTYLRYLKCTPAEQELVPPLTAARLKNMYDDILSRLEYHNTSITSDKTFIKAIGMFQALDIPQNKVKTISISLDAKRMESISGFPNGLGAESVLAEYQIQFQTADLEDPDKILEPSVPMKEESSIRILLQIPPDLRGKKNVEIYAVDASGTAVPLHAKVRSTRSNLVMAFDITAPGRFLFVSQPK